MAAVGLVVDAHGALDGHRLIVVHDLLHLVAGGAGGGAREGSHPANCALGHLVRVASGRAEGAQLLAGLGPGLRRDTDPDDGSDDAAVNEATDVTHVCLLRDRD